MTYTQNKASEMVSTASNELDTLISTAIKKVGGAKENDLCRYLPMTEGGYMHHFTLRKMKHHLPEKLSEMIKAFITNAESPKTVPPKQRAARGSRKKKDHLVLSKSDLDHILSLARSVNAKEIIQRLMPQKDLKTLKKELLASIRREKIEQELWNCYVESIQAKTAVTQ
jgi:hypothetical protein